VQGREVRYGSIVQLRHVTSGGFVTVSNNDAHCNPDARRVCLEAVGGESAWMRIVPRLRVHSEGERVREGDPIGLVHVATSMKLHVEKPLPDERLEVTAGTQVRALRGSNEPPPQPRTCKSHKFIFGSAAHRHACTRVRVLWPRVVRAARQEL
jgi:hypothetical protein